MAGHVVPVRESGLNFFFGKRRRHQHRSGTLGRLLALDETWIAAKLLAFHRLIVVRRNDHRSTEVPLAKHSGDVRHIAGIKGRNECYAP